MWFCDQKVIFYEKVFTMSMVDHNVKFPSLGLTMTAIEDFMEQYCGGELELGRYGWMGAGPGQP